MAPHASVATMSLGSGPEQRPVGPRLALPVGGWLAHHDVGPAGQPRPLAARDAARGRLLALGAGLLAMGALVVTARSRARSRAGQLAGRYARALGQPGCEELDVRIGGIRALELVAPDPPGHHPAVTGMLAAFIWERSGPHWPLPGPGGQALERPPRPDVQAAITTLGRRVPSATSGLFTWLARTSLTPTSAEPTSPARCSPARSWPGRICSPRSLPARTFPAQTSAAPGLPARIWLART